MEELILIRPTTEYAAQIRAFRQEFSGSLDWLHGARGLAEFDDPEKWIRFCAQCEAPETAPEGAPPSSQFIYVRLADRKIVGMIGVRHTHTEPLESFGGHVGYCVCPSERRKGYAARMLRAVLPHCAELGLKRVLLTCGHENAGSRQTILAGGGVFEGVGFSPKHQIEVERYWIDVQEEK